MVNSLVSFFIKLTFFIFLFTPAVSCGYYCGKSSMAYLVVKWLARYISQPTRVSSSRTGCPVHSALCQTEAKSFVNYFWGESSSKFSKISCNGLNIWPTLTFVYIVLIFSQIFHKSLCYILIVMIIGIVPGDYRNNRFVHVTFEQVKFHFIGCWNCFISVRLFLTNRNTALLLIWIWLTIFI